MRIRRLDLLRFGHFCDGVLDVSDGGARLHVVYGPNEAGKSTALAAIGDLLFGIPMQSPYNFLHDYKDMRIGAELETADGQRLTVQRRKGRSNTLLDADDNRLDDRVLDAVLGGTDRRRFEALFGLSHESLRRGGDEMLKAEGHLGEMLFGAGGSVAGLTAVRERLNEEADAVFASRRARHRQIYAALEAYNEARRAVAERSVAAADWRRVEQDLDQTEAAAAQVHEQLKTLEAQRARAERIKRVRPLLAELAEAETQLAALAGVPDLPPDSEQRRTAALHDMATAAAVLRQHEAAAAEAQAELDGLEVPDALLAVADEVARLYEARGAILKSRLDLEKRRAERRVCHERLTDLTRRQGLGLSPEESVRLLPPEPDIAQVRSLITRAAAIDKLHADARARLAEAEAERARLQEQQADLAPAADVTALARSVAAVTARGDLDGAVAKAEQAADRARARVEQVLAALPLWTGTAAALAAAPVPGDATLRRFETDMTAAAVTVERAGERLRQAREDAAAAERGLAELQAQGELPTPEAVAAARRHRDLGWHLIRRRFVDCEAVPDADLAAFAPPPELAAELAPELADAYQHAVAKADSLADRREAEAARLSRHATLAAELAHARGRAERDSAALAAARAAAEALAAEWRAAWQPAGVVPQTPREMADWLAARTAVLRETAQAEQAEAALTEARRARDDAATALREALLPHQPEAATATAVTALLHRAEAMVTRATAAAEEQRRFAARLENQTALVQKERTRVADVARDDAAWRTAWMSALAAVGLGAATPPAAAEASLELWQQIRSVSREQADLDHRIERMLQDADDFAHRVGQVLESAGVTVATDDLAAAAAELFAGAEQAKAARDRRRELGKRRKTARKKSADERARIGRARAVLDELCRLAGCAGDEDLAAAIDRARAKSRLTTEIDQAQRKVLAAADGLTVEAARAEADGSDADALAGELAAVAERLRALVDESRDLGQRLQTLRLQRDDMARGRGAAEAAQDMRDAVAALQDGAERWMVLKTATFLLHRGVDRFRRERQGPLLRRAEALFRTLTRGSFSGFRIDYDTQDNPVLLGVRADGRDCPVDGMSDGTRDQLFLALRLAAVEEHARSTEPLPFVADDLFVHFDDDRAAAGLDALVELGATTQVLLFTHHLHLAELASARGGKAVRAHRLAPAPVAVPA